MAKMSTIVYKWGTWSNRGEHHWTLLRKIPVRWRLERTEEAEDTLRPRGEKVTPGKGTRKQLKGHASRRAAYLLTGFLRLGWFLYLEDSVLHMQRDTFHSVWKVSCNQLWRFSEGCRKAVK